MCDFLAAVKNGIFEVQLPTMATIWVTFVENWVLFTPTSGHTGPHLPMLRDLDSMANQLPGCSYRTILVKSVNNTS